jgi:hypothetical protein
MIIMACITWNIRLFRLKSGLLSLNLYNKVYIKDKIIYNYGGKDPPKALRNHKISRSQLISRWLVEHIANWSTYLIYNLNRLTDYWYNKNFISADLFQLTYPPACVIHCGAFRPVASWSINCYLIFFISRYLPCLPVCMTLNYINSVEVIPVFQNIHALIFQWLDQRFHIYTWNSRTTIKYIRNKQE